MDRHPSGQPSNLHKVLETCKRVSLLTVKRPHARLLLTGADCFNKAEAEVRLTASESRKPSVRATACATLCL